MKKLVVYYSLDGNTRFVARTVAEAVAADLLELDPKDGLRHSGFMRYVLGGIQVMTKHKPELAAFDKEPKDYGLLFIGTPVWAWSYAPAIATFFGTAGLKGKKIALFCCSIGARGGSLEKMKGDLAGNEIVGEVDFIEPLTRNQKENAAKARKWARDIDGDLTGVAPAPHP